MELYGGFPMKLYSFFLSFCAFFAPTTHTQSLQPLDLETKRVVVVFDVDDVITHTAKKWNIAKHVINPFKWKILKQTNYLKNKLGESASADNIINEAQKRGWNGVVRFMNEMTKNKLPIAGTVSIIKQLHKQNIELFIGTNIGKKTFEKTRANKINKKLNAVFEQYFNLEYPQCVDYGAQKVIKKPHVKFFEQIIENNNFDLNTTHVIFIDDKKANVKAARKTGMIGIQFKNPKQLERDLKKLGIL